ncbi:MAG: phospholipase D-like domain-containing protein, partial [Aeromonas sp.]
MLTAFTPEIAQQLLGWSALLGHLLLLLVVAARVITRRRPIGESLAWITLIAALPLVGLVCYLLFGEVRLGRKRALQAQLMYRPFIRRVRAAHNALACHLPPLTVRAKAQRDLILRRLGMPMLSGDSLTLHHDSDAILGAICQAMAAANESIYAEFYIWQSGAQVQAVHEALIHAAQRGVDCRLLLDSIGSYRFFRQPALAQLRAAGVQVIEALPVAAWHIPFSRQDLRMHRKLVVIDGQHAFTGSMNMSDAHTFKHSAGLGQWVDIMLELRGPTANLMQALFAWDWELETGERLLAAPA